MSYDQYPPPPPPPASPDSYSYTAAPPPQKSGVGMVLLILGVLGGGFVLLCCGGGGAVMWFGSKVFTEQVRTELEKNPVIVEHVGEIQSMRVDWVKSAAAPGADEYVFDIEGTKGRGRVTVESITVDDDTEEIRSGTLKLDSGETFDLLPDQ